MLMFYMKPENNNMGYSAHLVEETLVPKVIHYLRELHLEILISYSVISGKLF